MLLRHMASSAWPPAPKGPQALPGAHLQEPLLHCSSRSQSSRFFRRLTHALLCSSQ